MRYFFEVSYAGRQYQGWQNQPNGVGVQQVLEDCLTKLSGTSIGIVGSGRTDAGVHCEQQFFHADLEVAEVDSLLWKMNSFLPADIAIRSINPVTPDAHARFSALSRTYEYRISTKKNPFLAGLSYYFFRKVDVQAMNEAALLMLGSQDFTSFSKVKTDVNHFLCTVFESSWAETDEQLVFTICANRFLRGMVRATVGTLLEVGLGKISVARFAEILSRRDRREAGPNVPAQGLFLVKVSYPDTIWINK